jgi:hypothetical protein
MLPYKKNIKMKKEDLQNYTKDEIDEMFINLIDEMEHNGNRYMDEWKKNEDRLEYYTYGGALLTRVNQVKAMVSLKNSERNGKRI